MHTNFQSLAATAILLCATIAAPGIASAATPRPHIAGGSAGYALSMNSRIWSVQGVSLNENWADLLGANVQFATDNLGDVDAGPPVMQILNATDFSPTGDTESAILPGLSLITSKATRWPIDLGYHNPGAPLPQSVSWALMIGGIGFAAALFRLSSAPAKTSST